mgnify:CR=1 FL=1
MTRLWPEGVPIDVETDEIVARGLARSIAGGTASHSAHAKHLAHTLLKFSRGQAPDYAIKDEAKFFAVLDRVGIERDGAGACGYLEMDSHVSFLLFREHVSTRRIKKLL